MKDNKNGKSQDVNAEVKDTSQAKKGFGDFVKGNQMLATAGVLALALAFAFFASGGMALLPLIVPCLGAAAGATMMLMKNHKKFEEKNEILDGNIDQKKKEPDSLAKEKEKSEVIGKELEGKKDTKNSQEAIAEAIEPDPGQKKKKGFEDFIKENKLMAGMGIMAAVAALFILATGGTALLPIVGLGLATSAGATMTLVKNYEKFQVKQKAVDASGAKQKPETQEKTKKPAKVLSENEKIIKDFSKKDQKITSESGETLHEKKHLVEEKEKRRKRSQSVGSNSSQKSMKI